MKACENIIQLAKCAAGLERNAEAVRQNWKECVSWLLAKQPDKTDSSFEDIEQFLSLSAAEKNLILLRHPKLKLLIEFLDPEAFKNEQSDLQKIRSAIRERIKESPNLLTSSIRAFHSAYDEQYVSGEDLFSSESLMADEVLDQILTLDYRRGENAISGAADYPYEITANWPKSYTQTPYAVIRDFFHFRPLRAGDCFIDLGAGYGRVLLYGSCVFPEAQFTGVEIVESRAAELSAISRNAGLKNIEILTGDALELDLSMGTVFYMYNPFHQVMNKALARLREISRNRRIEIITAGQATYDLMNVPWLKARKSAGETRIYLSVFESI